MTNGEGYYTFASVPVGAYVLTVEATGFQTYKAEEIHLGGGDRRNINVSLVVGSTSQTIEVSGVTDASVGMLDSGEKSSTLATKELQNFIQVGSNAAEYIKISAGIRHLRMARRTKRITPGKLSVSTQTVIPEARVH